jgi:hypothetical protein
MPVRNTVRERVWQLIKARHGRIPPLRTCYGHLGEVIVIRIDAHEFENSPRLSGENSEHTRRLAEVADPLPPIVVHRPTMRVIDGLHRVRAAQLRGEQTITVHFFVGDDDSAFLLAVEANMAHGLPLSLCERKAAAVRLIAMFPDRSDRSIAASAGISDKTVASLRSSAENPRSNARIGVDGRSRPVDGADRRRRAARLLARQPQGGWSMPDYRAGRLGYPQGFT